jgi:hypothetical protein
MIFYYDAENNIYLTHLDAIASRKQCWFYYYDDILSNVPWKIEPTESLETLYKLRAQKIRDTYDYVILCFSGGADSTNVLESFYYNNIHIDEIVMVGAFSQDKFVGDDSNHNAEIHYGAYPTLKTLNLPNTKITAMDYSLLFDNPNNFSLIREYGNEWTKYLGYRKSVHCLFWRDFKYFVGAKNNKKTCYVLGTDKVDYFRDNRAHITISDVSISEYGNLYSNENFDRVNFYTSHEDTALDIIRKQAHIVHSYDKIENIRNKMNMEDFKRNIVEKLVYNHKNPVRYISKKSKSSSISERDMFMLNAKNTQMYDMFFEGLKTINKISPINKKDYPYLTKPYFIE